MSLIDETRVLCPHGELSLAKFTGIERTDTVINSKCNGWAFSSDRAIQEYCHDIQVEPIQVELKGTQPKAGLKAVSQLTSQGLLAGNR